MSWMPTSAKCALTAWRSWRAPPNLGLLWNADSGLHVAFTLFPVANGYGLRGFLRERGHTLTWELAFSLQQDTVRASNVVNLRRRRWPRKA